MVTSVETTGLGVVEGKDAGGGVVGRVTSTCSPVASQGSPNDSTSSQQDHIRTAGLVKENGSVPNQERTVSSVSSVLPASTPTPPPLKPAPSPFSNTFPSLGQMPSLVPGAPAPKSSPTLPAPEREDSVLLGYPKTAALVSPGPVTISSPSQDNASSVALSTPVDANQKSMWGSTPEASQV